ncbi:MAG: class I SAM-dependent methyltransferase [Myxococcota bacterium]
MHRFLPFGLLPLLAACASSPEPAPEPAPAPVAEEPSAGAETDETPAEPGPSAEALLDAAIAGEHRSEDNRARDAYRHPKETLLFFGLEPDMTVVELSPSGGWYSEVLAPVVRERGKLVGAIPSLEGPGAKYAQRFLDRIAKDPEVFEGVETVTLEPPEETTLGPEGSADMVLTFRSTHGWVEREQVDDVYEAAYRVLKPGGVFGVVQHRADEGADPAETAEDGYVPEAHVIEIAEDAGFELVESSDINANPKDTHDHPEGVWTLPPSLRVDDEEDRAEYEAIGESDRMTLKFRKPAQ